MVNFKLGNAILMMLMSSASAFAPSSSIQLISRGQNNNSNLSQSKLSQSANDQNLVVISPPGGIGEVAAVQAAKMGSSVRWFVISPPSSSSSVTLSASTLQSIAQSNGGTVELAGAQADTILLPTDDPSSAVGAVSTWCSSADSIVCVLDDGIEQSVISASNEPGTKPMDQSEVARAKALMADAIKVAAREASKSCGSSGKKIAVLPTNMEIESDDESENDNPGSGLLQSIFGQKVDVPKTLMSALRDASAGSVTTIRYGELFGLPESSPDASPFIGGPRKIPVLRDEYTMRGVRIDPSISVSGNTMMSDSSRSSRLSVGEAAVRMANKSFNMKNGVDICITSLRGMEALDDDEWSGEFDRVQTAMAAKGGAELFTAAFGSVPSVERFADWVATKWAPAVLKTYDIAGIRVGGRPVYASKTGEGEIEIVWQELKDFKSFVVGRMIIEITETGISARRGAGDASSGYGSISKTPLAGEDILVRRLSEAALQATEKGLATKPAPPKRRKKEVKVAAVVSTVVSSGETESAPVVQQPASLSETGPRTSGARRSSERTRGKRRKARPTSNDDSTGSFQ